MYGLLFANKRGKRNKVFWGYPHSEELWNEMSQLGQEVKTLTPVLYSLETPPAASTKSTAIEFVAKTYNGQNYVIALNKTPSRVKARLSISGNNAAMRRFCLKTAK